MVQAQRTAGSFSIGAFGGINNIMSPEVPKDWLKMGIGFGGELKYNLTKMTALTANFTYISHEVEVDAMNEDFDSIFPGATLEYEGGDLKANIISGNVLQYLTKPEASFGLYATIGAGYYMVKTTTATMKLSYMGTVISDETWDEESEDKFGLNGGLGFEIMMGDKLSLFAEGKYHLVFTGQGDEDDAEFEEAIGKKITGKTSFISAMGGIRFSL